MDQALSTAPRVPISLKATILWTLGAILSFHVAYTVQWGSFFILIYLYCLGSLVRLPSSRQAFYLGFAIGLLCFAPQLICFYTIFRLAAVPLWAVLAFWHGVFLLMSWSAAQQWGVRTAALLLPFLWTGIEYFRSELYYLRFAWLNPGFVFSTSVPGFPMHQLGVYGAGFMLMALAALVMALGGKQRFVVGALALILTILPSVAPRFGATSKIEDKIGVLVAGIQMEFPLETEIPLRLTSLLKQYPEAQVLVMSEYSLDGPVPAKVLDWCRNNQRYLIIGGKDPVGETQFRNTAFVIGPQGQILFRQAKSVPIQFFKDGLPALEQKLWESPWGKIGICICYDLSYRRVTDPLIRMGAQALIVPTMDVVEWGKQQHELHARVARVRAAEYRVPLFRLASSGISQAVDATGQEIARTHFAEEGAMISQRMTFRTPGSLPLDRWLAPGCVGIFGITALALGFSRLTQRRSQRRRSNSAL